MTAPRRTGVPFSHLARQFADIDAYLADIAAVVRTGDFTLGEAVREFELRFARASGLPHAVGVGSGTDAIALSLRACGVGPGDEVITATNTFIATVGAIAQIGAIPVLVDNDEGFVLDAVSVEAAVTPRTRAIVPVHYTGNVADMPRIAAIAARHHLTMIEDACQAIGASLNGKPVGSWGETAAFSLHPLKNLNVWGDAGVIATHSATVAEWLRRMRNHGLVGRDEVESFGWNSRMDTVQAVVGNRLIEQLAAITARRIENAQRYDAAFTGIPEIRVPARRAGVRHVYHLYVVRAERRDDLWRHLLAQGIEAKVHYPTPIHLQPAARHLGYAKGSFPTAERDATTMITLPVHQHLHADEIEFTIDQVRSFYGA